MNSRLHFLIDKANQMNGLTLSTTFTAAYFLFYSAYDKTEKTLVPSLLLDIFLFRRGVDFSLKEINKVISLSGLTGTLVSFLPELQPKKSKELLFVSMNLLWVHSVYSFYKWWDCNPKKLWADKPIKKVSVLLGSLGQLALAAGFWGKISPHALLLAATTLGMGHFVTMEVDYKYQLQVRPFAYLPFPLAFYNLFKFFFP